MLSKLLLCSVIILLAAQGATSQGIRIDPVTCVGNIQKVTEALQETVNLAQFAYQRQVGLLGATLNYPDMRVTMNAFRAYFGTKAADGIAATGQTLISKSVSGGW